MKTSIPIGTGSIAAGEDINRFYFVGFDGNLCAANARAVGVSAADTIAGRQLPFDMMGILLVTAGGAISAGAQVASDANGKAVAASSISATTPTGATPVTSTAAAPTATMAGGEARNKVMEQAEAIMVGQDQAIAPWFFYVNKSLVNQQKWGGLYANAMDIHPTKWIHKN